MSSFDLTGRNAVVTGANAGIGQAIAIGFARAGADVALLGRTPATETCRIVNEVGRRGVQVSADLAKLEDVEPAFAEAENALGTIDILVNNAGIIRRSDALDFSSADWDDVMDVNLRSLFFLCQAAGRRMVRARRGKIINIASMLTFQGGVRVASYTAAKSGVGGVTKLLANEWAASNVNVNAIAPGYIATANTTALRTDPARNQSILERIPSGRWGSPDDLVGAAIFLASDASAYVHGHILAVDGGWLAR